MIVKTLVVAVVLSASVVAPATAQISNYELQQQLYQQQQEQQMRQMQMQMEQLRQQQELANQQLQSRSDPDPTGELRARHLRINNCALHPLKPICQW